MCNNVHQRFCLLTFQQNSSGAIFSTSQSLPFTNSVTLFKTDSHLLFPSLPFKVSTVYHTPLKLVNLPLKQSNFPTYQHTNRQIFHTYNHISPCTLSNSVIKLYRTKSRRSTIDKTSDRNIK
jgi:hypothetical protein